MIRLKIAIVMSVVAMVAAACGSSDSDSGSDKGLGTSDVTFALDFAPDGLHAPLYLAQSQKLFGDKVNLTIQPGQGSANTIKLVAAGRAQLGFADASAVSNGIAGGAKVTAVALLLQHSPAVTVVSKSSKATTIKDLSGMSVGDNPQASTGVMLPAVLAVNDLKADSVKRVSMSFQARVPSLTGKKVDAIGGYAQEFVSILDDVRLIPWYENGLDAYGTVVIANNDFIKKNPDAIRDVVAGLLKGLKATVDSPSDASQATAADKRGDASFFEGELGVLKPYFIDPSSPQMDAARWDEVQSVMMQYGGQTSKVNEDDLFTNDFLPK